jgi:hypothetical protein
MLWAVTKTGSILWKVAAVAGTAAAADPEPVTKASLASAAALAAAGAVGYEAVTRLFKWTFDD